MSDTQDIQRQSPCASCHSGCCRSFAVPLTGADVLRIQNRLNLSFWDFACRWADPEGTISRNHAPHFYFADEPETPFVICLLHKQSAFFQGTTTCQFLIEGEPDEEHPLGIARCGIYEARPVACRCFPAKLNDTGDLAIIENISDRFSESDDSALSGCPRQWEPEDLDPVGTMENLVIARYEMQYFHKLAEYWNQTPGDWQTFPEFLHRVYSRRLQPAQAAVLETKSLKSASRPKSLSACIS